MKKLLTVCTFAFFICTANLSAFSWGGVIDNNSRFAANNDLSQKSLIQTNDLFLSFSSMLGKSGTMKIAGEGLFKSTYAAVLTPDFDGTDLQVADCDLLKFSGNWSVGSGAVSLNLGRFQMSDITGSVFAQTSDGLSLAYNGLSAKAGLYAGYTGLLNRLNVSMVDNEADDAKIYALCPAYIPVLVDLAYKTLFETSTIGLQADAFIPKDSKKNTMKLYGTLYLTGPLSTAGTYSLMGTLESEKFKTFMLDAKADFNFYLGTSAVTNLGVEYASGENGPFHSFTTITARSLYNGTNTAGLIIPKLSVMYAKNTFFASITEKCVITMPEKKAKLDGFDTSVSLLFNILSDVQMGVDGGAYICLENKESSNYFLTIKASLAF